MEKDFIKVLDNVKLITGFITLLPKEIPYLLENNNIRLNSILFSLKESENILLKMLDDVYAL